MLNDAQIKKFQELYRKNFGRPITREIALEKGLNLVRLMELIYKPMTENESKIFKERTLKKIEYPSPTS